MTKLEEIAKAIKDSGAYTPDWQGCDEDLVIMARAAVEAPRELSEEILILAQDTLSHKKFEGDSEVYRVCHLELIEIHRVVIDTVLNEKP